MADRKVGIIMHGATGRMGLNQHLVRSILAMRDDGGLMLQSWTEKHFVDVPELKG